MPLKLVAPRARKTPYWSVRATHLGRRIDRSTKTGDKRLATKFLKKWQDEIERGTFESPGGAELSFAKAACSYMKAGGDRMRLVPILKYFGGDKLLTDMDQSAIDDCATYLFPTQSAATRNRECYTPISAVLKHAGIEVKLKRPKGWRGNARTVWMTPEQAFRLIAAAKKVDAEFGLFLHVLLYTGMRLSEACNVRLSELDLSQSYLLARMTKNGEPRGVYLPPCTVAALANHPRGLERKGADTSTLTKRGTVRKRAIRDDKLFRFVKCGRIYDFLDRAKSAAGDDLGFVTFHVFCHTWATWMRQYAGLDPKGLTGTGRWRDEKSASRYQHVVTSEESRKAIMLPVVENWRKTGS